MADQRCLLRARGVRVTYRVRERPSAASGFAGAGADGGPATSPGPSSWPRRRGAWREVTAVDGVDLGLSPGDRVGIVGANGSGKSSLLRVLAGLLPPDDGTVHAVAEPILLGVTAALDDELTGSQNVVLGLTALGLTRTEAAAAAPEVLDFAGVADAAGLPLRTYSTGMRARLAFAVATTVQPEILLIDEALKAGDAAFRPRSAARIADLADAAGAVVVVSHTESDIRDLCTRAIWLEDGRIRESGGVDDVWRSYATTAAARR